MKRVHLMLVAVVVFLVAQLTFGALPEYEIIDLGTLGGSYSSPSDINDDGQVVGHSWTADGPDHGFLWDEVNGMIDITELLGETAEEDGRLKPIAINNNGQILYFLFTPTPNFKKQYIIWNSETSSVELILPTWENGIRDINDNMQVAGSTSRSVIKINGTYDTNDNMQVAGSTMISGPVAVPISGGLHNYHHASLWDSVNGTIDLGTLGGNYSYANNINESGVVVGASETGNLNEAHAFIWDSVDGMIDLGALSGTQSSAWTINNFDKVAGASVINERDENGREINHAFVWTEADGMIDIHDSSYLNSIAFGVNDADQAVGVIANEIHIHHSSGMIINVVSLITPALCRSAFLWDEEHGMVDLNDLLAEDSGWDHLETAKDINYKGQIIGVGYINGEQHAFLMNPIIPAIPAEVEIRPGTLNLSGRGKFNCNIELPEDYDVVEINTDSILLAGAIEPDQVRVDKRRQVVTARFDREGLRDILEVGEVELTVSGELTDGTRFEGTATIKVILRPDDVIGQVELQLPEYEIIDLGTLGGSSSYPLDINDDGQVVGTSGTADGRDHGFLWDEVNGMIDMTDLLDENSDWGNIQSAVAINNNGQIVGSLPLPPFIPSPISERNLDSILRRQYFLWDIETGFTELITTEISDLIRLMMSGDGVRAINDNMQVAVSALPPSSSGPLYCPRRYHASLWDSVNGITDLGILGCSVSYAHDINESGIVVGASETGTLPGYGSDDAHAFLWDSDNGMIDLGTLGGNKSSALAINNFDKVVGASVINDQGEYNEETDHAFIWTEADGMVDIHGSSYHSSIALGINDADQVVGIIANNSSVDHLRGNFRGSPPLWMTSIADHLLQPNQPITTASLTPDTLNVLLPPGPIGLPIIIFDPAKMSPSVPVLKPYRAAFLWDKNHGMIDLNDLLDEDSEWDHLKSAKDINYRGQIIGIGYINGEYHAFLMNPVLTIEAEVEIRPGTLNLSGRGKFNCNIELPEDYDVAEINTDSILLEGTIEPDQVRVDKRRQIVTARFDREGLRDILEVGEVELTITGELIDGTRFEGTATIRVIDRAKRARPAVSKRRLRGRPRNR